MYIQNLYVLYIFTYMCILYMNVYTLCMFVNSLDSHLASFMFIYVFLIRLALGGRKLDLSDFF